MVARLKLKGIDGRAPPGVNYRAATLLFKAARKGEVVRCTSPSGDTLKLREIPKDSATKSACESRRWPG